MKTQVDFDMRDPIIVEIDEYKGKTFLDVRHFWKPEGGDLAPTKKGIHIPVEGATKLQEAIAAALADFANGEA